MAETPTPAEIAWLEWFASVAAEASQPPGPEALAWAGALREDARALEVLDQVARSGGTPEKLLTVAAIFRFGPESLEGGWTRATIGPARLAPEKARNIDELLAALDQLEALEGRPSQEFSHLRSAKPLLDQMADEIRESGGEMRSRDAEGREHRYRPIAPGVIAQEVPIQFEAPLRPDQGSGRRGDPALNVVSVLVAGHINAITGSRDFEFAIRVLIDGLRLLDNSATDQPRGALKRRLYRVWEEKAFVRVRDRAQLVAGALRLQLRLDG